MYITHRLSNIAYYLYPYLSTGIINFTGPDNNITMSNMDNSLFLRARSRQKDVVARTQPNVSSQLRLSAHYY